MALANQIKSQVSTLSQKVQNAEKAAGKQVKQILKSTEKFRGQQVKKLQQLVKKAEGINAHEIVTRAKQARDTIESSAALGMEILLNKFDLPSKKDFDRLNKKVVALQKRLDEIEKTRSS